KFSSSDVDVVQEDNVKIVRAGEDVKLTCTFSTDGKSLQIVSFYIKQQPSWNKDFEKANRFIVIKGDDHFNLTILKTKSSDSATYFCVVSSHYSTGMGAGTRLLVKGMVSNVC
uniref:Ig-like domain-containing protein n=1 Tax=Cyprinus carpio TaxID=7962 RepID=A0A8C1TUE8_CYPCA